MEKLTPLAKNFTLPPAVTAGTNLTSDWSDAVLLVDIVCDWILNIHSFQIQNICIERVQYDARPPVGDQPTAGQAERKREDPVIRPAGEPDFLRLDLAPIIIRPDHISCNLSFSSSQKCQYIES